MAAPTAPTGVVLNVPSWDAANDARERAEARDDLAIHAIRVVGRQPPTPTDDRAAAWARTRAACERFGLGAHALTTLDTLARDSTPTLGAALRHAAQLCIADAGFVLIVIDPTGDESLGPALAVLAEAFDRSLEVAPSIDAVRLARPDPARLASDLDRDLVAAALGDPDRAATAWRAWHQRVSIDDARGFGQAGPLLAEQLEQYGIDDPDLPRIQGVRRRAWYALQLLVRAAAATVQCLRDVGCDPVVTGELAVAVASAEMGAVRNGYRIDLQVSPEEAAEAAATLLEQGWVTPRRDFPKARITHQTSASFRGDAARTLVLHWQPLPHRAARLVSDLVRRDLRACTLHNVPATMPSPTDLLITHWARTADPTPGHLFRTLTATVDILRLGGIDGNRLWSACDRLALTPYGAMYARLLESYAGVSVPRRPAEPGSQAVPPCE